MGAEQLALAQVAHHVGELAGQRSARGLHVPDAPLPSSRSRPRHGRELAVQGDHGYRSGAWALPLLRALLERHHRVLQRRVVQLHHVRARLARSTQPPSEVHVHDVEAAAPEPEVQRRAVHHHVVTRLDRARERRVGDSWPQLAPEVHA